MTYFWLILTIACLVWYGTVTILVTVRGYADIREMMSQLGGRRPDSAADVPDEPTQL